MKFKLLSLLAILLVCAMLMLVSCHRHTIGVGIGHGHKSGPPPHAPAHGYRHKYQGVELVYDSEWGVYIVVGFPYHYYYRGCYYQLRENQWEMAVHFDGPWKIVSKEALPPGLRAKDKGKGKSHEHPGRGRGVQKQKW